MKIKCIKCNHEWDYKGESQWFVTCSICRKLINIRKQEKKSKGIKEEVVKPGIIMPKLEDSVDSV